MRTTIAKFINLYTIRTLPEYSLKNIVPKAMLIWCFGDIAVRIWVGIATLPAWRRERKGKGFSKKAKKFWEFVEIASKFIDLWA